MKRASIAVAIAVLFAGTQLTLGQDRGNPFVDHSDNGETIHVLPPVATLHSPHATGADRCATALWRRRLPAELWVRSPDQSRWAGHGETRGSRRSTGTPAWPRRFRVASTGSSTRSRTTRRTATRTTPPTTPSSSSTTDHYLFTARTSYVDTAHDGKKVPNSYSDASVRSYIASLFAAGAGNVVPSADTIYGVYFPSGMRISTQGGGVVLEFLRLSRPLLIRRRRHQVRRVSLHRLPRLLDARQAGDRHPDDRHQPRDS